MQRLYARQLTGLTLLALYSVLQIGQGSCLSRSGAPQLLQSRGLESEAAEGGVWWFSRELGKKMDKKPM